jgi:para-nitrobenzyl esterase
MLSQGQSDTVETESGRVRGLVHGGAIAFKNIPYGAPTSGANRFRPPRKPVPWAGVRDAFAYGDYAPPLNVHSHPSFYEIWYGQTSPSEDCLNLNVWAASASRSEKRPVLVWLHGGGFSAGSASTPASDGTNLAARGDVVVVTLNHRLNVFGYTDLSAVAGDRFAGSGQGGMLDIVAALSWIKANIANFGGDPDRVTVFGNSGGGQKICTLMAMPSAAGLFHRAIVQSGPAVSLVALDRAAEVAAALLQELGLGKQEVDALQKLPVDTITAAALKVAARFPPQRSGHSSHFQPVVDGKVIAQHPFAQSAPPTAANVPLMIGTTRTEATFFLSHLDEMFSLTADGLKQNVTRICDNDALAGELLSTFSKGAPKASPSELLFLIISDQTVRGPSIKIAEEKSRQPPPVFMYRFDRESPLDGGRYMAPHSIELPFVFNNHRAPEFSAFIGANDEADRFARQVADVWVAFARDGNPSTKALGEWPRYTAKDRATMILNTTSRVEADPDGPQRKLTATWLFGAPGS